MSASVVELRASMRAPRPRGPKVNWWALAAVVLSALAFFVWKGLP